jgi:hypothetical protein
MHRPRIILALAASAAVLLAPGCYYSGAYVSDNLAIVVNGGALPPQPVINGGATVQAVVNEPVTLRADISTSGNVVILSAQWIVLSGPGIPASPNPNAAITTFTFPVAGQYILVYRVAAQVNGVLTSTDSNPVTVQVSQFVG